ncbi:hypothetical protein ACKS23_09197 [Histoplasma ohiense]
MTSKFFFFFFFFSKEGTSDMYDLQLSTIAAQNRNQDQKNARTPKSCQPCAGAQSMAVDGGLPITGCRLCFPAPCDVGSRANFPFHDVLFDETNSCVKSRMRPFLSSLYWLAIQAGDAAMEGFMKSRDGLGFLNR